MRASRPPLGARLLTGRVGFFVAGTLDVSVAWGRWGWQELTRRMARRVAR